MLTLIELPLTTTSCAGETILTFASAGFGATGLAAAGALVAAGAVGVALGAQPTTSPNAQIATAVTVLDTGDMDRRSLLKNMRLLSARAHRRGVRRCTDAATDIGRLEAARL